MTRTSFMTIVIGKQGTGKSTMVENMAKQFKGRVLVMTYAMVQRPWASYPKIDLRNKEELKNWKTGIRHVAYTWYEQDTWKLIYENYQDGIILFDDCKEYISSARPDTGDPRTKYLRSLISNFRHKQLDLFFIFHTPSDVLKLIWGMFTKLVIFATDELITKKMISSATLPAIVEAQLRVNKRFADAKAKNNKSDYGVLKDYQEVGEIIIRVI